MTDIRYRFTPPDDGLARIVLSGYVFDRDGHPRFPPYSPGRLSQVWCELRFWLEALRNGLGDYRLLMPVATGVDVLAVAYAIRWRIRTDAFLPMPAATCFTGSTHLHEPQEDGEGVPEGDTRPRYAELNRLFLGLLRTGTNDRLIAYWDGREIAEPGGTGYLVSQARQRGVGCWMLREGLHGADPRYDLLTLRYTFL